MRSNLFGSLENGSWSFAKQKQQETGSEQSNMQEAYISEFASGLNQTPSLNYLETVPLPVTNVSWQLMEDQEDQFGTVEVKQAHTKRYLNRDVFTPHKSQ